MTFINQVLAAEGVKISTLPNSAPKIPLASTLSDLLTKGGFNLISFIFVLIGLAFFGNLVLVGWGYMMSSGDPKKVQASTTRLLNGFFGLVLVFLAFIIVRLIGKVLGLNGETVDLII